LQDIKHHFSLWIVFTLRLMISSRGLVNVGLTSNERFNSFLPIVYDVILIEGILSTESHMQMVYIYSLLIMLSCHNSLNKIYVLWIATLIRLSQERDTYPMFTMVLMTLLMKYRVGGYSIHKLLNLIWFSLMMVFMPLLQLIVGNRGMMMDIIKNRAKEDVRVLDEGRKINSRNEDLLRQFSHIIKSSSVIEISDITI